MNGPGPTVYLGDDVLPGQRLKDRARRAASGFRCLGVGREDCVAILMRNDGPFLEATVAAQTVSAYPVPLNWHFTPDELLYVIGDCTPKVLVSHADLLASIVGRLPDGMMVLAVPTPQHIAEAYRIERHECRVAAGWTDWNDWLSRHAPLDDAPPAATDSLIYTSGTSGHPKGVRRKPPSPDQAEKNEEMRSRVFGIGPGDRVLVSAPLYHTAPNFFALRALRMAETLVLPPRFDPKGLLADIERHRITHLYAVPTMFVRLLELDPGIRRHYDLTSLRFVLHAGGPCSPSVKLRIIEWLGPVVHEYYGSTEHGPLTFCTSEEWLAHRGTVGRPAPGVTIRIEDSEGNPLPTGSVGEILAKNAAHPDFTYHNRQAERDALQRGELIRTGDMGYVDQDGFLYLCDRKRDLIISGGVNIYPAEIEGVLSEYPGVRDTAVFGIPDPAYGEAVMAVVQPCQDAKLEADAIRAFLKTRLAAFKLPRVIEIRHDLPREESGKIRKRLIREPYWKNAQRSI
ncbi:AMP-binding protein [Rhodoligotrophos defluvii]|uniref:AMP-binding protein n=1 Tax=Rhodoligotrophos defluvii TaxID=2561934 RepID=UPI0010C97CA5|nr:AMP-binding protein [Rhodoligotrophos defluvii]